MFDEGLIDSATGLTRVEPDHLIQMMAPAFDPNQKSRAIEQGQMLAKGLPAGPGAASGRIALTSEHAVEMAKKGPVLLVRAETSPEDIAGLHAAVGIVTARGGMTSHAAVVARGMGKPCVVGAGDLDVDEERILVKADGRVLKEGDEIAIDGSTGLVLGTALETRESPVLAAMLESAATEDSDVVAFRHVLSWADEQRRMRVKANADTPHDARVARALGGEGIGLCRTEHMFFEEDRIGWMRQVILGDAAQRQRALEHLLPVQQADFEGILAAMDGLPVTIRLLDPPLHEFLPREARAVRSVAQRMGIDPEEVTAKATALSEANPMLGHRGCRLGITMPDLYEMQVTAIVRAAIARTGQGGNPRPEIMVPLVGTGTEMAGLRARIDAVMARELTAADAEVQIPVGTMIEVPRAALCADQIAVHAEFFSFGTNDLTQMAFGFSRDDIGTFLPEYLEQGILAFDPFARIDEDGVGKLVQIAVERGRRARPTLQIGVCGEHGGDPSSVRFFERCRLDSVSCSPYRVPIARLASARAVLGL
jgi:pyruvate,orthophosphate dikinase